MSPRSPELYRSQAPGRGRGAIPPSSALSQSRCRHAHSLLPSILLSRGASASAQWVLRRAARGHALSGVVAAWLTQQQAHSVTACACLFTGVARELGDEKSQI